MDPFHERLAKLALDRIDRYGFALAGGYAVQAHGMVDRPSEDVDLFTTLAAEADFDIAVAAVVEAYRQADLDVEILVDGQGFSRLQGEQPGIGSVGPSRVGDRLARAPADDP